MDFKEARTKMEFGLILLGSGDRGYKFVTEKEWVDTSEACTTPPHLMDLPSRVCGDCKIFYIAKEKLGSVTDEELVFGIHALQDFIRNGTIR